MADTPTTFVERKRLTEISARAYEHPADRAALSALRKVPGFDLALQKLIGLLGEKSLYNIYLASAVRVGDDQLPRLNALYRECIEILDLPDRPPLFVAQTPFVNAGAVGTDKPFVVINSATVNMLDDDGVRYILGHELGHIMSDHVLYKTMLKLLLQLTMLRFAVPLGALALYAILAALLEWDRKSELSADRAGLLCVQDPEATYRALLKMSGGTDQALNLEPFLRQADEYKSGGGLLDRVFKFLNLLGRTHPFPVMRLAELRAWVESGVYEQILAGEYERRGREDQARLYDELAESLRAYKKPLAEGEDALVSFLKDMKENVSDAGSRVYQWFKDHLTGTGEPADANPDESPRPR